MVTFDDGARGVWRFADPVLARFNQHAVAFIITGFVGTHEPYYMTWDEIADLHNSGRWDLEAHTHLGHVQVPSDSNGGQGPYLTTPEYLPAAEPGGDARGIPRPGLSDLTECKHQFALHNLPYPSFSRTRSRRTKPNRGQ